MSTPPYLDLPAGVRRIDVTLPRGPLATLQTSIAEPAGTLLLVPGFTGSKEDFLPILGPIAAAGFDVIALDLRGQFESPGPDDVDAYTEDDLAADVIDLARRLEGNAPVHLVGHSMGGLVVRRALIAKPECAVSVTLLCSGPGPVPAGKRAELAPMIEALPNVPLPVIWEHKQAADRANGWAPPSPEVDGFVRHRFAANNPSSLLAMAQLLCHATDSVAELRAAAEGSGVRVLVAHGAADDVWSPAEQAEMAERLGADYRIIAGAQHSPAVEQPAATAALLTGFAAGP